MILKNSVHIKKRPETVWRYIEDPVFMKSWNPKIKDVIPVSWGKPRSAGFKYRLKYEVNGREGNFEGELMEYEEPRRFVLHLTGGNLSFKGYVQEIYELNEFKKGTLVRHNVEIHSSMNPFSKLLIRLRHLFGRSAGRKYLSKLRKLAEN